MSGLVLAVFSSIGAIYLIWFASEMIFKKQLNPG